MEKSGPGSVYDAFPYPGLTHIWTHPARMHAAARFLGLQPAPIERCRVLEVGCGDGTNLLAMAEALPNSEFVGIDYTARHIVQGSAIAAATGITNVRLEHADIRDFGAGEAPFDYIIAHGVFSWVPPEVRTALLRLCRRLLAPYGVAEISYNTLPGWAPLIAMRSVVSLHTRGIEDPAERVRQGRALIEFLDSRIPDDGRLYSQTVRMFADDMAHRDDAVTLHDELNDVNEPYYFMDFVAEAEAEGLSHLHDARFSDVMQIRFDAAAMEQLQKLARDTTHAEQISDFLLNRSFRRSLLCHVERDDERHMELTAAALEGFHVRGDFKAEPGPPGRLRSSAGPVLTPESPAGAAALTILGERFPAAVPFAELVTEAHARFGAGDPAADADAIAATCVLAYSVNSDMITPWPCAPRFTLTPGERPLVSALNRYRASTGERELTDAFHARVELGPLAFALIPALDGTRDRAALLDYLATHYPDEHREHLEADLEAALEHLARAAMLVG